MSKEDANTIRYHYLIRYGKYYKTGRRPTADIKDVYAKGGMLTYHSDKWTLKRPKWVGWSVSFVTDMLRRDKQVGFIWEQIVVDAETAIAQQCCPEYSLSLELCAKTWLEKESIKLHCHLVLHWQQRRHYRDMRIWALGKVAPTHFKDISDPSSHKSSRSIAPMHYYLQMPKVGMVRSQASVKPFVDFAVNPRWISGYLQQGKISVDDAHRVIVFLFRFLLTPFRPPHAHPPPGSPGGAPCPPRGCWVCRACRQAHSSFFPSNSSTRTTARTMACTALRREACFWMVLVLGAERRGPKFVPKLYWPVAFRRRSSSKRDYAVIYNNRI